MEISHNLAVQDPLAKVGLVDLASSGFIINRLDPLLDLILLVMVC